MTDEERKEAERLAWQHVDIALFEDASWQSFIEGYEAACKAQQSRPCVCGKCHCVICGNPMERDVGSVRSAKLVELAKMVSEHTYWSYMDGANRPSGLAIMAREALAEYEAAK